MSLISVIVPIYYVEPFLRRCVDSILSQTFTDFELILVDDGSPDNCPAVCDEYVAKDSRVKVIHKENGGVSSARNAGLDLAAGKYITFVDGDDYIANDWFRMLFDAITGEDFDCISGDYCQTYERCTDDVQVHHQLIGSGVICDEQSLHSLIVDDILLGNLGWSVCFRLFSAAIIQNNHLRFCETCEDFAEDMAFVLSYYLFSHKIGLLPYAGYFYYANPQSMTHVTRGQLKLNALNEVAQSFGSAISASIWKGTEIEKQFPFYHFLIMNTEFRKVYYGCGFIRVIIDARKIESKEWYKKQSMAFSQVVPEMVLTFPNEDVEWSTKIYKVCSENMVQRVGFIFWCLIKKIKRKLLKRIHFF